MILKVILQTIATNISLPYIYALKIDDIHFL